MMADHFYPYPRWKEKLFSPTFFVASSDIMGCKVETAGYDVLEAPNGAMDVTLMQEKA
jgi:hypothetical protein